MVLLSSIPFEWLMFLVIVQWGKDHLSIGVKMREPSELKKPLTLPSPARGEGFGTPLPRREGAGGR